MKLCLACRARFDREDWICPSCGSSPQLQDGRPFFAPALADDNEGMPDTHAILDIAQERNFWFKARNRLILDLVQRFSINPSRVLEIGCGTGYVLSALRVALPDANLCGAEIYASGLAYASKRLDERTKFLQMDAQAIPFDAEFDLIWSTES